MFELVFKKNFFFEAVIKWVFTDAFSASVTLPAARLNWFRVISSGVPILQTRRKTRLGANRQEDRYTRGRKLARLSRRRYPWTSSPSRNSQRPQIKRLQMVSTIPTNRYGISDFFRVGSFQWQLGFQPKEWRMENARVERGFLGRLETNLRFGLLEHRWRKLEAYHKESRNNPIHRPW